MDEVDDDELVAFLRARIAEDQAVLSAFDEFAPGRVPPQRAVGGYYLIDGAAAPSIGVDPWRHVFECQLKGDLVRQFARALEIDGTRPSSESRCHLTVLRSVVHVLANLYADHPDFRQGWETVTPVNQPDT